MEPSKNHLPSAELINSWPKFTSENPLKILVSGCLAGLPVGTDGSTYGDHPTITSLISMPVVKATTFCPENFSFGTPRAVPDIQGGDGYDVLAGRARVVTPTGEDWTTGMIAAAHEMLKVAEENEVRLAVLMDISAACGSQVIHAGTRPSGAYLAGAGVCAALLIQSGIPVVSQRDWKTLDLIFSKLDAEHISDQLLKDHHESDWYVRYFSIIG